MQTFYITLEPLEPYFFGTEKMSEAGNRNNYYQKSAFYPQQTAILGMLRFLLGSKAGFNENIIGESSFDAAITEKADFKQILSISPVFVVRNEEKFFDTPFDYDFKVSFRPNQLINFNNSQKKSMPVVDGYDPKDGINYQLISKNRKPIPLSYDAKKNDEGVFWARAKDGNEKARDGKAKDNGYYRFEYVRMNNAYFGFFASFDDAANLQKGQVEYVFLGGQQSSFKLTFVEVVDDTDAWKVYLDEIPATDYSKIVLLSDTYLEPSFVQKADFSITELVSFRNLKTSLSRTKNWSGLSRNRQDNTQPQFSAKLNLLKKGSVLYFLDSTVCQEVEQKIISYENFQQIGYNQIVTIHQKTNISK